MKSYPKHPYIRDKKLTVACRSLACQHCGIEDGTVVAAHANWGHGKGGAIKADDSAVAALCWLCHAELDQGRRMSKSERMELWQAAHVKTVALLKAAGQWGLECE